MQVPEPQPRSPEEAARKEREPDLYAIMEKAMAFYRAELKKSPRAIDYLKGRGLTGEIAARYRMGYAPDDWQALKGVFPEYEDKSLVEVGLVVQNEGKRYDRFRDRVMFPILSARGTVIGFGGRILDKGEPKYMNSPETPLFEKGRELYGLPQARDAIRAAGRVLVVEGYMDVVALAQYGVGNAVATLGTATTPIHVSKLLRVTEELVFCFDGDAAGRKAAWRALEVSLPCAGPEADPLFCRRPRTPTPTCASTAGTLSRPGCAKPKRFRNSCLPSCAPKATCVPPKGRARFVSMAKPHIQKITAPALRLQITNEIARLAEVGDGEINRLLELPRRPSPGRRRVAPPTTRRRRRNGVCSPRCSPTCRSSSTLTPATSTPSARRRAPSSPSDRNGSSPTRRSALRSSSKRSAAIRALKPSSKPRDMLKTSLSRPMQRGASSSMRLLRSICAIASSSSIACAAG